MSEDDLMKLKKNDLLNAVRKIKEFTNDKFLNFIDEMKAELEEIKLQLTDLGKENNELKKKLDSDESQKKNMIELERNTYDAMQYIRRNNIEISGIPDIFTDDKLESKVIEICELYGVNVDHNDFEACHRLPKQKKKTDSPAITICRFVNRRITEKLIEKRKSTVDVSSLGIPEGTKLYFNENLCRYYNDIWFKCRKLKKSNLIKYVWTNNGVVKIKRDESSPSLKITHLTDIFQLFPEFDFSQ